MHLALSALGLLLCSLLQSMWSHLVLNHAKHFHRPVDQHVLSGIHDPEMPVDTQSSHVMTVSNLNLVFLIAVSLLTRSR